MYKKLSEIAKKPLPMAEIGSLSNVGVSWLPRCRLVAIDTRHE